MRTALVGKTHMAADAEGMARLGIDPASEIGVRIAECGFDPFERDDGLHSEGPGGKYDPREPRYNAWLRELGYASDNPWEECANSGEDEDGNLLSGWLLRNSTRAARGKQSIPRRHTSRNVRSTLSTLPVISLGVCTCLTSSRTGRALRRRLITRCIRLRTCCR